MEKPKETVVHLPKIDATEESNVRPLLVPTPAFQREDPRGILWKSCCFKLDKRVLVFFTQLIISIIILLFSILQLVGEHGNCEGSAPYLTLISTLIGYWLPSPSIK